MQSMHLVVRAIQAHVLISKFWNSERRESCLDFGKPSRLETDPPGLTDSPALRAVGGSSAPASKIQHSFIMKVDGFQSSECMTSEIPSSCGHFTTS